MVVTPSWRPHVHDLQTGTVDRAAYTCCVLDQVRTLAPAAGRAGATGSRDPRVRSPTVVPIGPAAWSLKLTAR